MKSGAFIGRFILSAMFAFSLLTHPYLATCSSSVEQLQGPPASEEELVTNVKSLMKGFSQGKAAAEKELESLYTDPAASQWFQTAAEQGNPDAQVNLGRMCILGKGVQKDEAEAARWYRKAAEQGDANGEWGLGWVVLGRKRSAKGF